MVTEEAGLRVEAAVALVKVAAAGRTTPPVSVVTEPVVLILLALRRCRQFVSENLMEVRCGYVLTIM